MMIRYVALSAQPLPLHTVVHDEFHVVVCVCVFTLIGSLLPCCMVQMEAVILLHHLPR